MSQFKALGEVTGVATGLTNVTIGGNGPSGHALWSQPSLSVDGRFLVYASAASNLVPGDANGRTDVFLRDNLTGVTRNITLGGNGSSGDPQISAEGRFIVFTTEATNLANVREGVGGRAGLVVYDTESETMANIVHVQFGHQAEAVYAVEGGIAFDGESLSVAYRYHHPEPEISSDLDPQGFSIFRSRYSVDGGTLTRTSTTQVTPSNSDSFAAAASADGSAVAFADLDPGSTGSAELRLWTPRGVQNLTTGANGRVRGVIDVSSDGRFVAFDSYASNLVTGDTNGVADVFVLDRRTGSIRRVSRGGNGESYEPSISDDGRFVTFRSSASNLVAGDDNGRADSFIADLMTGEIRRYVQHDPHVPGQISGYTAFAELSGDGRTVAFASSVSDLVPGDTNGTYDIFLDSAWQPRTTADFNRDGTSDILLQGAGAVAQWFMHEGAYSGGNAVANGLPPGWAVVGTGDFNGDGLADVVLQGGSTVVDWFLDANGDYIGGNVVGTLPAGARVAGTGDVNGDGITDLVLQGAGTVFDWMLNASGGYQGSNVLAASLPAGWQVMGVGDLSGDGIADVVLQNGGTVVDWLLNADGGYAAGNVLSTTVPAGMTVRGIGDFNGDGSGDLVLQGGSTVVDWLLSRGAYVSGAVLTTTLPAGWNVMGTGDYNGDGTSDISLQGGGMVVDWLMENGQYAGGNVLATNLPAGWSIVGKT